MALGRKLMFYINKKSNYPLYRKIRAKYFFKNQNITLGKNVRIFGLPFKINVGKNVRFLDNMIIEFGSNGDLQIGDNCLFSYGVLISNNDKIYIGNNVQVGEYTSIRDTTHRYDRLDVPIRIAGDVSNPIFISDDVWIGRGCIILPGTKVEEGVVIGANSVVKGVLFKNGIYAGSPAKLIKSRG